VVPGFNPVIELVKLPLAGPLLVLLSEIVGFWLVPQQTPLAVTVEPPSEVTFPPLVTELEVMFDTVVRVTVGATLMASFLQVVKRANRIIDKKAM
jgi:hypothetical protein